MWCSNWTDSITQATKKSDGSRVAVKMVDKVMVIVMVMVADNFYTDILLKRNPYRFSMQLISGSHCAYGGRGTIGSCIIARGHFC